MNRDQKVIIALAIALFVACIAIACMVGLAFGGSWGLIVSRASGERMHVEERERIQPLPTRPPAQPQISPVIVLVVLNVTEDGPAAKAGIQPRDLIVAIDGERIERGTPLAEIVSAFRPGDRVRLTIRRGDTQRNVQVKLGAHPQDKSRPYLGLTVRAMPVPSD